MLADHAGLLGIERPVRNQELHGDSIVARAKSMLFVKLMCFLDHDHVVLDTEAMPLWHTHQSTFDLRRLLGEALAVLPVPMRIERGYAPRRGGADLRKHGERDVEMIVGMRAPCQAPFVTNLRDPDRALHRPEMRSGHAIQL